MYVTAKLRKCWRKCSIGVTLTRADTETQQRRAQACANGAAVTPQILLDDLNSNITYAPTCRCKHTESLLSRGQPLRVKDPGQALPEPAGATRDQHAALLVILLRKGRPVGNIGQQVPHGSIFLQDKRTQICEAAILLT